MLLEIKLNDKGILVLAVVWFSILSAFTTSVLIAEQYSAVVRSPALWGVVSDMEIAGTGQWQFTVIREGQESIGMTSDFSVKNNDQIVVFNVNDAVSIPFVYSQREWVEIFLNGSMISTNEPHNYMTMLYVLWAVTIIIISISMFMSYRSAKVAKQILEVEPR